MHFLNCLIVVMAAGFVRVAFSSLLPGMGEVVGYLLQLIMLLVFVPTMMASIYIAYREIFETAPKTEGNDTAQAGRGRMSDPIGVFGGTFDPVHITAICAWPRRPAKSSAWPA